MQIGDAELGQNHPAVKRESAEEHDKIQRRDPELLEFVDRPLLQAGMLGSLVFHHSPSLYAPSRSPRCPAKTTGSAACAVFSKAPSRRLWTFIAAHLPSRASPCCWRRGAPAVLPR